MLRLNEFLKPLMQRLDLYQPCRDRLALVIWPEIVGPYVGRNTVAVAIRGGILFVRTASAAWMTELRIGFAQQFIAALNQRLGEDVVKDIRFLPPPLPEASEKDAPRDIEGLPRVALTAADESLIDEVVATLEVPELRHRMRRLMRRDLALRRARMEAGWRPCPQCRVLTDDGRQCAACKDRARRNRILGIRKQLLRAPWVTPLDVKARFPEMTLQEYQLVKGYLLRTLKKWMEAWHQKAPADKKFSDEALGRALRYCMLRFGKRPHELSPYDIRVALGRTLSHRYPE